MPGEWPSLFNPLWIRRMASVWSVVMGSLFLPGGGQQKTRRAGGLGWIGKGRGGSVGSVALERIETDIRAMRDLMFEAFQRSRAD